MSSPYLSWLASCALGAIACGGDKRSEFIDPAEPAALPDGGMQVPERGPGGVTGSGSGSGGSACARTGARTTVSVSNGGFEKPSVSGAFEAFSAGDTELEGWKITGGSVDLVGSHWAHAQGSNSVDMNGVSAGTLTQDVTTKSGEYYELSFSLAGNPNTTLEVVQLRVAAGSNSNTYRFEMAGRTVSNMGWKQEKLGFVASGATTALRFQSMVSGDSGPALDSVSLSQVQCLD